MTRALLALLSTVVLVGCGNDEAAAPASTDTAIAAASPAPMSASSEQDDDDHGEDHDDGSSDDDDGSSEASVILAGLGGDYVNADLSNGARQFRRCQSCHTLNEGGRNSVGPNLYGIIGQPAARVAQFSYSSQLSDAGLVWDLATLDAWIENPRALVTGNRMSFVGLRDAEDRRDVIAYIAVHTTDD